MQMVAQAGGQQPVVNPWDIQSQGELNQMNSNANAGLPPAPVPPAAMEQSNRLAPPPSFKAFSPTPINRADYQELLKRLADFQSLKDQQTGIGQQEALQNAYAQQPNQVNLAPLAALVDSWTGSKLSQGYKPPTSADERAAMMEKLSQGVAKSRGELTKDQISLLKSQLESQDNLYKNYLTMSGQQLSKEQTDAWKHYQDDLHKTEKTDKDVSELSKRTGDGLPGIVDRLGKMDEIIANSPAGTLPGFSGSDKYLPDYFNSPEGRALKQDAADLLADTLKMYSGATVSDREASRRLKAMGQSMFNTPDQFINGLKNIKDYAIKKQQTVEAGFAPDAVSLYKQRGGVSSDSLKGFKFEPGSAIKNETAGGNEAMPKAGDVVDNHVFLGGNPGDAKSWQMLRK